MVKGKWLHSGTQYVNINEPVSIQFNSIQFNSKIFIQSDNILYIHFTYISIIGDKLKGGV